MITNHYKKILGAANGSVENLDSTCYSTLQLLLVTLLNLVDIFIAVEFVH